MNGRVIFKGEVEGEALVSKEPIGFLGGVDPATGELLEGENKGQSIKDKILVFPTGKGSTVGSYTLYRLKHSGMAPVAIINEECETITAVGCIISEIPCVDQVEIGRLETGMLLKVDGENGLVMNLSDQITI